MPRLWIALALIVAAVVVGLLSRCRHAGPLGLLPPHRLANGEFRQAHWYCPHCEKEWPAVFDRPNAPVQKYSGYDPSKLIKSARRARELDEQQRRLAVSRAGVTDERIRRARLSIVPDREERSGR